MRRFLQFRLRTLFVLTTLVAVICAVGIPAVKRYREYQRNLAAKRIDAYIMDRLESVGGPAIHQRIPAEDLPMIKLTEIPSAADFAAAQDSELLETP